MTEQYFQYEIAEQKGFYAVYFDGRFLVGVDSSQAAKEFVDRRAAERLSLLLSAELGAMSDRAMTSIDSELAYKKGNPSLGWLFYEISQEATTNLEIEIVNSVAKEIPYTMAFGVGYSNAQNTLLPHSEDQERQAYADSQKLLHEQLECFVRTLRDCVEKITSDSSSLPVNFDIHENRVRCQIKPLLKPESYIVIEGGYIGLFGLNDEVLYLSHSSSLFLDIRGFYGSSSHAGIDISCFYSHVRDSIQSFYSELFDQYKGAKAYSSAIRGYAINSLEDHFTFVEDMILNDCVSYQSKHERLEGLVSKIIFRYAKGSRALRDMPLLYIDQIARHAAKTACKNKHRGVKGAVNHGEGLLRSYCHQRNYIKRKDYWWRYVDSLVGG